MARAFASRLRQHLGSYKRRVLGIEEAGFWAKREKPYQHILPAEHQHLNILPSLRESFWSWHSTEGSKIKLHKDFKHLNSSQALAFNLFFPAMSDLDDGVLLKTLGIEGAVEEFCFEKVLDGTEGTNVDFFIRLRSGARCFFEVKLTEQKFGSCADDERHQWKLNNIYIPRLKGLVKPECLDARFVFKHYQLLRNISYLNENPADRLFLLFPRANEMLAGTSDWLNQHVVDEVRPRIRGIHIEDVVEGCQRRSPAPNWEEFEAKYCCSPERQEAPQTSRLKMG
jgi:hypothetical protein